MVSLLLLTAAVAVSAQQVKLFPTPWSYTQNDPPVKVTVNTDVKYQKMVGGGCSAAFNVACDQTGAHGLSPANQQRVADLLFNENLGALTILRNRIGSSASDGYLASCPATPSSTFNYTFSNNNDTADSCQLKVTRQALIANPELQIYADAWSANACFKTDKTDINGGQICGVRGTNCTYDWRQGYADYLVQYVKFYAERGINVTMLGAYNEPDFNPVTYASMQSDGYQAYDFLKILYPTVKAYRKDLLVACCDGTGARQMRNILYELNQAGGGDLYDVLTYHGYQSDPERPFDVQNGQINMQTEWSDGSGGWNDTWDTTGQLAEGIQWAMYMHNAIVNSNTSAYLHWWCAQNNTGGSGSDAILIQLKGDSFDVSRRLWAFRGYFGFARPDSYRVDAKSSAENMYVTAFVNTNGTVAVPIINEAHYARQIDLSLSGCGLNLTRASVWLADNDHNNTVPISRFALNGTGFMATLPPRSMVTYFLE